MSANYKLVRTPNPKGDGEITPYHARMVATGTIGMEEMMDFMASSSSFSSADVKGVLQLLQDMIVMNLQTGYNVHLEGIGTFSISLHCPPAMDKKKVRSEYVSFRSVNFRPSVKLNNRLRSMHFYRAEEDKGKKSFSPEECKNRLLLYLEKYNHITGSEYMGLNHCCRSKASSDLMKFRSEGIIQRKGRGPTTYYIKKTADKD